MDTSDRIPGWYRFGVFEVDERRGEVRKRGLRIRLRGRPLDILVILLERPGELVTRDDLRSRLWAADTFVDFDHGLNTAVNRLREVLGDSADNPRFIETVPRKGYRFIAPVDVLPVREPLTPASESLAPVAVADPIAVPPVDAPQPTAPRRRWMSAGFALLALVVLAAIVGTAVAMRGRTPSPQPGTGKMTLAVLPFENLSGDPEQDYLSDGFTEEMISELGTLEPSKLGVIARTTTMLYKGTRKDVRQIGTELGVNYVLEGSVRKFRDQLRITVQLVEAATQTQLWSDSYDRKAMDIINIQTDVAMRIASSLIPTLTRTGAITKRSVPTSFSAYELVLRGKAYREQATEEGARKAIEYLDRAIAIDPAYAPAHAWLGDCYRLLGAPGWEVAAPDALLKKAREAAERALVLEPSSADAHAVRGIVKLTYEWDIAGAEREIRTAIQFNPSLSKAHQYYSAILTTAGRFDEAIEEARRGLDLDPMSATAGTTLGVRYWYAGRIDEAEAAFRKTLELNPEFSVAHWGLAQTYRARGQTEESLDELTKAVTLSGNSSYMRAHLGYGFAVSGDRARAEAIKTELEAESATHYVAPYHFALIAAGLGDHEGAARWLQRAYDERSGWMVFLPVEPEFQKVKQAPDVQRLLASVRPMKQ